MLIAAMVRCVPYEFARREGFTWRGSRRACREVGTQRRIMLGQY
jgi:hypothetical protein